MPLIDEVVLVLLLNSQVPQLLVWRRTQRNSQSAADRPTNFTPSPCHPEPTHCQFAAKLQAWSRTESAPRCTMSRELPVQPASNTRATNHRKGLGGSVTVHPRAKHSSEKKHLARERDNNTTAKSIRNRCHHWVQEGHVEKTLTNTDRA